MSLAGSIVDVDALLDVVWTSLLAGIGVTGIFAVAILGGTRAADASRGGRTVAATAFGVLAVVALAGVAAAVVFGIVVMTQK
jgi:hypothetical protein